MNDIEIKKEYLPNNIEELSKFTLIGRDKLMAVRAEIRAIEKVGLAKEVYDQKLAEAQEIAEIVLDAETQMGRLLQEVPKAKENQYTKVQTDTNVGKQTKTDAYKNAGLSEKQAQRFQTLARHPEEVERAKADARNNNRIVTRSDVFREIKPAETNIQKVKRITAEREEYKNNKSDVVDLADIRKDNHNKRQLALIFYNETMGAMTNLSNLMMKYADESVKEHVSALNKQEVEKYVNKIEELKASLYMFANELIGGMEIGRDRHKTNC